MCSISHSLWYIPSPVVSLLSLNGKHTSRFAHGDRLNKVLRCHVQLPLVLHGAKHAETMLVGRHVHVSIFKVGHTILQT